MNTYTLTARIVVPDIAEETITVSVPVTGYGIENRFAALQAAVTEFIARHPQAKDAEDRDWRVYVDSVRYEDES